MTILSTQINGFIIDTLNPMAPMLRSTVQKVQQLDDQYFGPVNAMIAEYRETVAADYSAYVVEWMTFGGAIATYIWECTADQRTEFLTWAEEVDGKIAQFDWLGFTLSAIDTAFTASQFIADVLAVVWVIASFLWVTLTNHISDPYEGSDFAIQMHVQRQELRMHRDAAAEAIAESQARICGLNQAPMDLDMDSLNVFNSRFQEQELDPKDFALLAVFAQAFAETVLGVKEQPQPLMVVA